MVSRKLKFKIILILISFTIVLTGCGAEDLKAQKQACKKQGHIFYIKKSLNPRTGEYEVKGICKNYT